MVAADLDGERFRAQPMAAAALAGAFALIALEILAHPGAVGLAIAALHIREHAFKGALHIVDAAAIIIAELDHLLARAMAQHGLDICRELGPFCGGVEAVMLGQTLARLLVPGRVLARSGWVG